VTMGGGDALLVLEDGTWFRGQSFGAAGEAFGEAVFNTGMAGYQEVLTDPSYRNQVVTMTAPHVGNCGMNEEDAQSGRVQVAAFVVREASGRASSWRATGTLRDVLTEAGVVAIEGVDTRSLTLRIRRHGAMRAGASTEDLDAASLVERVGAQPSMEGCDLAAQVSADAPYQARDVVGSIGPVGGGALRVAAYDFGIKRSILRLLADNGCETRWPAAAILAGGFDGVFLSNGPGDPAATTYGVQAVRELLGRIPVFGICLGHQLMGIALGGRTFKLKFGHRGVNQPVKDLDTGRVEITSHNHGFAVDPAGWEGPSRSGPPVAAADVSRWPGPPTAETPFGRLALTRWNLNDGTVEGMRCLDIPAFSVQYHPEAAPGPHDARHLFARFRELMG
jgi:carbamoyl-phosphate synthase small subunit